MYFISTTWRHSTVAFQKCLLIMYADCYVKQSRCAKNTGVGDGLHGSVFQPLKKHLLIYRQGMQLGSSCRKVLQDM